MESIKDMQTLSNPKIVIGMASRGYDLCPSIVTFVHNCSISHQIEFMYRVCSFNAIPAQEGVFWGAHEVQCDYLLIIDSDVAPPANVLDLLLLCKKDIVVAPVWHYNAINGRIFLDVTKELNRYGADAKLSGVEAIVTASFGCVLVSKKVIDTFFDKKEYFVYWSSLLPIEASSYTSDAIFYLKAAKLGFQPFVCWDASGSEHYTRIHLSNRVLRQFMK